MKPYSTKYFELSPINIWYGRHRVQIIQKEWKRLPVSAKQAGGTFCWQHSPSLSCQKQFHVNIKMKDIRINEACMLWLSCQEERVLFHALINGIRTTFFISYVTWYSILFVYIFVWQNCKYWQRTIIFALDPSVSTAVSTVERIFIHFMINWNHMLRKEAYSILY